VLCMVANDAEAASNDTEKQCTAIQQPADRRQPLGLQGVSVLKGPSEASVCDTSSDLIRIYGGNGVGVDDCLASECPSKTAISDVGLDVITIDDIQTGAEHVGVNGYRTVNADHDIYRCKSETIPIRHGRDISDGLVLQNPSSNNNHAISDNYIEDCPHLNKSDCLSGTNITVEVVDNSATGRVESAAEGELADASGKSDCDDSLGDLFDDRLAAARSADDAAHAVSDPDPGSFGSAEKPAEECPPADPASDKPPSLSFSPDVLLVAPTGKAANVLGRRTGLQAFTMHQVIFNYHAWRRSDANTRPAWKFDRVRALVVDECSLVAVTTFHSLIRKVLPTLQKVVLLGDVLQLPSIEPGTYLQLSFSFKWHGDHAGNTVEENSSVFSLI